MKTNRLPGRGSHFPIIKIHKTHLKTSHQTSVQHKLKLLIQANNSIPLSINFPTQTPCNNKTNPQTKTNSLSSKINSPTFINATAPHPQSWNTKPAASWSAASQLNPVATTKTTSPVTTTLQWTTKVPLFQTLRMNSARIKYQPPKASWSKNPIP